MSKNNLRSILEKHDRVELVEYIIKGRKPIGIPNENMPDDWRDYIKDCDWDELVWLAG